MRSVAIVLGLLLLGSSAAVAEDDPMEFQRCIWRCLANSGGASDPAYNACVQNICEGGSSEPVAPAAPSQSGRWTYGRHPVLGLSAHVDLGDSALGIACIAGDGGYTVAHRMTPGLVLDPTLANGNGTITAFRDPFVIGGSNTYSWNPEGFFETKGDYCTSSINPYMKSRRLVFIKGEGLQIDFIDPGYRMTVTQNGEAIVVTKEADLDKLKDTISVPLAGSTAAIRQMIRACPALQREISDGCGDF